MDLVVLAAGMGSRFGGLKQIEPIDSDNNFILDYSIHDAIRAGFDRVVFIIKEENYEDFNNTVGKRLAGKIPVAYAFQNMNNVPKGFIKPENRIKPWGTAHAIYCCKDIVDDKFAVINADDFYGYESFELIANFLKNNTDENVFISAGYQVKNTLTDKGSVKRGVFKLNGEKATALIESEVKWQNEDIIATPLNTDNWKLIDKNTLVSMTMFGFSKKLIDKIVKEFDIFFKKPLSQLEKEEFLLPEVVNMMIKSNEATLIVRPTTAKWYGITYKEDLISFKQAINDMKKENKYPLHLY